MNGRETEMAAAIEAAEAEVDDEFSEYFSVRPPSTPSQVYSIRIPVDQLEQLRLVAGSRGIAPSVLMRQWVLERLNTKTKRYYRLNCVNNFESQAAVIENFGRMETMMRIVSE